MSFAGRVRLPIALCTAAVSAVLLLIGPSSAAASSGQLAMFQNPSLAGNPTRGLQILRSLGVGIIRLDVSWATLAPDAGSRTPPIGFDATNPAAYPAASWAQYDTVINDARNYGIRVDVLVDGSAPLWATAPGPTGPGGVWKPSATAYGQFVEAVAKRYNGAYVPPGASSALPRVNYWELWDEGNWGQALAPQIQSGSSTILSAIEYRSLLDQGWSALQATGHGSDTVIAGSLSQDGSAVLTPTATIAPLTFLRALYCVNGSYQQLRGSAAQALNCPTSGGFASNNPVLFRASGIGLHPYPYGSPPNVTQFRDPNGAEFNEIPQFTKSLDRLQKAYGSQRKLAVFNTEYGYETRPPQRNKMFPTPANAARYINWAEYLSYKNPRITTYDQYELQDSSWFTTGLLTSRGKVKPSFYSYRMPVFLPVTSTKRGRTLQVWGCVRPAHFAQVDTGRAQYVSVQFAKGSGGHFRTIKTVRIGNSRGYFDVRIKFPSSGQVRLAWQYPRGDTKLADPLQPGQNWIYSRTTGIKLR